jgi:hypothetical protein
MCNKCEFPDDEEETGGLISNPPIQRWEDPDKDDD